MPSSSFPGFQPQLFRFLEELSTNNNRKWFEPNKSRYERDVREPSLEFIRAFGPRLKKLSPFFVADDRRVGGSLMRIFRDTRFAKDKTPYKTNVGIQFRHELGKDVHAPGFYVHLAPDECFLAVGLWRPEGPVLARIRQAIVDEPAKWKRTRDNQQFRQHFDLAGDSLKTAPRGVDKDHPLIDDLKRKDFIAVRSLSEDDVLAKRFLDDAAASFATARSFLRFLCEAIPVPC